MPTGIYTRTKYHCKKISNSLKGKIPKNWATLIKYVPEKKMYKICPMCKNTKPRNDFGEQKDGRIRSYCQNCFRLKSQEYRLKYPDRFAETHRNSNIKRKFGISSDDYQKLLFMQNGKCAICFRLPETRTRKGKPIHLAVDHNHITGKIRGLLCADCNRALGQFKESSDILIGALKYLGISTTELKRRLNEK